MEIRIYDEINIPANMTAAFKDVQIPQGNWRIVSLMSLANVASSVVTKDVETMITLNEPDRLRATEEGHVEPFVAGPALLRATVTKKAPLPDVFVRVVITLEQA